MDQAAQEPGFETAMEQLEKLVAEMESGALPLESLIDKFETGSQLAAYCRNKLSAMQKKVEILTVDDQKNGIWAPFPQQDSSGI